MMINKMFLNKIKRENNLLTFKLLVIEGKVPKEIINKLPTEIIKPLL